MFRCRPKQLWLTSSRLLYTQPCRTATRTFSTITTLRFPVADNIRNVAIVAHVDHGKTTLVDVMLREAGQKVEDGVRLMDSNDLERERGITILAKTTSFLWDKVQVNIVDTPGHADFGGVVERTLSMVDGVVLLVDINEGVMAQTKFVVSKAIKVGLRPIVCLNKVDRCENPKQRADVVLGEVFDLLCGFEASDEQLDFPVIYASAKGGWAIGSLEDTKRDSVGHILNQITKHVPAPTVEDGPFRMLVSMMEHDPHFGTVVTGRVTAGSVKPGVKLKSIAVDADVVEEGRLLRIMARRGGLNLITIDSASAGEIVTLAGFTSSRVTNTICDPSLSTPLPTTSIDPPTISMTFGPNTSPLAGRDGSMLTASHIYDRLTKETATNVSMQVVRSADEAFEVRGRGPLQMGILVENMRREGFELSISSPKVIFKEDDGVKLEPIEELTIEVDDEQSGAIIELVSVRKGELLDYTQNNGRTTLRYLIPARGLLGLQHVFVMETRGTGTMQHLFHSYQPFKGELGNTRRGVLVSTAEGNSTTYALGLIEPRGVLFINEGVPVYPGMIVGEHAKSGDLAVNPARLKKLTNMRASGTDEKVRLSPPRIMTLEEYIAYVQGDELIEVTPTSVRLRKRDLHAKRR